MDCVLSFLPPFSRFSDGLSGTFEFPKTFFSLVPKLASQSGVLKNGGYSSFRMQKQAWTSGWDGGSLLVVMFKALQDLPTSLRPSGIIFCHCPSLLCSCHTSLSVFFLKLMSTSCLLGLLPFLRLLAFPPLMVKMSTDRPLVYQRHSCTPPTQSVHHTKPRPCPNTFHYLTRRLFTFLVAVRPP